MSDDTTPNLLDLMAEALTATFTGHPQRRHQALAANRVIAERMWPPVKAALDERDAEAARLTDEIERLQDLTSRLRADYRAEIAEAEEQIRTAEAEHDQFKAELRRLHALFDEVLAERDEYRRANTQLQELATLRAGERDKFEATIARVRARLDELIAMGFGARGDTLENLRATLDQGKATAMVCSRCHGHPAEPGFDVCTSCVDELAAINIWAANPDPHGEPT